MTWERLNEQRVAEVAAGRCANLCGRPIRPARTRGKGACSNPTRCVECAEEAKRKQHRWYEENRSVKAGARESLRYTPELRETHQRLVDYIASHPGASLAAVVRDVPHHYSSVATAREALLRWLDAGRIQGVQVQHTARRIRVFPAGADMPPPPGPKPPPDPKPPKPVIQNACPHCRARPRAEGRSMCTVCLRTSAAGSKRHRRKKNAANAAAGLCKGDCGRPRPEGRVRCDECHEKRMAEDQAQRKRRKRERAARALAGAPDKRGLELAVLFAVEALAAGGPIEDVERAQAALAALKRRQPAAVGSAAPKPTEPPAAAPHPASETPAAPELPPRFSPKPRRAPAPSSPIDAPKPRRRRPAAPPPTATAPCAVPPPIPISSLVQRDQRFRCVPYAAVITADACVKRQELARGEPQGWRSPRSDTPEKKPRYVSGMFHACEACKDGALVRQRVGAGEL